MKRPAGALALFAALAGVTACQSAPETAEATIDRDAIRARWPVMSFDGFEPYADRRSHTIKAYVDFSRDGLLRASLGCSVLGGPFSFGADGRLYLSQAYSNGAAAGGSSKCSDGAQSAEADLFRFLQERPAIGELQPDGLRLTLQGTTLHLASVQAVLDTQY